jgi:hypothetical protein
MLDQTNQGLNGIHCNGDFIEQRQGAICSSARTPAVWAALCLACLAIAIPAMGQDAVAGAASGAGSVAILNVVRWTGNLPAAAGQTVDIRFALYQNQAGGLALWSETQTVKVGADGRYTVLLGATSAEGLPPSLFQAGEAHWVEAKPAAGPANDAGEAAAAPARNLLAAVPYAFKSMDAETLAGRPADQFVTQDQLTAELANASQPPAAQGGIHPDAGLAGAGVANNIPRWTSANNLGDSAITQLGTAAAPLVGVATVTPATTLDVKGTTTLRGNTSIPATSAATATASVASPKLELTASSFKRGAAALSQTFALQAIPEGNNTTAPFADLYLFYGSGSASPISTGLHFSPNGQIGFAPGQTFPGTGTISGVTASSPLTGGGTSGTVTLGLSATALESTLNGVYAQLGAANTFAKPITFAAGQTFPGTGAGTITGVTATSLLTGGGTSGNVIVGLNLAQLENTLNNTYPSLAGNNTFTGASNTFTSPIKFAAGQTFPGAGAITGVTAGTGLTGGGLGGAVTLAVDPTQVPLLNASTNQFTGTLAAAAVSSSGGINAIGVEANGGTPGYFLPGSILIPPAFAATPSAPSNSSLDIVSSVFNSSGPSARPEDFAWVVNVRNNNTNNTYGELDLVHGQFAYGNSAPVLSISAGGVITFAQAQTFPGAAALAGNNIFTGSSAFTNPITFAAGQTFPGGGGTITGVTAGSGLTGGGTSGAVSLAIDTTVVPTLSGNNTFAGTAVFSQPISLPQSQSFYSSVSSGNAGTFITSDAGAAGLNGESATGSGIDAVSTDPLVGAAGLFGEVFFLSGTYDTLAGQFVAGVWGDTGNVTTGNIAYTAGVIGTGDDVTAGIFENNSEHPTLYAYNNSGGGTGPTGLFRTFRASTRTGTCGVGGNGDMTCTGQVKTLATTGTSRQVETYAMQSPENWIEDFGSGTLSGGVAVVRIDPGFAETVTSDASYHVFITPNGDSKGLYVIRKTATSFEVRESGGGTSSLDFDYRIVARRRGYETERLTDVTDEFNAEQKSAPPPPASGDSPQTQAGGRRITQSSHRPAAAGHSAAVRSSQPAQPSGSGIEAGDRRVVAPHP